MSELTEEEISEIKEGAKVATKGPWESFIEGRDHMRGSDFIRPGGLDDACPDIELLGATHEDQGFIAGAQQDIPKLIADCSPSGKGKSLVIYTEKGNIHTNNHCI